MLDDGKKPAQRLNLVDRFVTFFSPEAGMRRMAARHTLHEFGYNDVPERRGDSGGQVKNAAGESYMNHRDRIQAMWDARDAAMYTWIGGVLGRVVLYVCGELEAKSNTGDDEIDALHDEYFHNWCGDEEDEDGTFSCDLSGHHRFLKLVQVALMSMFVDGDSGFVFRRQPLEDETIDTATGAPCLQFVEGDRIGRSLNESLYRPRGAGFFFSEFGLRPRPAVG